MAGFTVLDVALLAICLLSGLLAMYRGLTREVLSILSWAIAGGVVLYFVLKQKALAQDLANQVHAPLPVVQVGLGAVMFLIVLIVVHLITARISDSILDSRVGMIDRIFGFAFGVARGFVLIVIPYMFYIWLVPLEKDQNPAVRFARTLPAIRATGTSLQAVLQRYVPASLTNPTAAPGTDAQPQG